jgi:hypothetical protein
VIIKSANVVEVPKSLGITIGLKLLLGEYPSLIQRAPHLKEISTGSLTQLLLVWWKAEQFLNYRLLAALAQLLRSA